MLRRLCPSHVWAALLLPRLWRCWFANERRTAVQAYRQRQSHYHSRAQLDEDRPGGRYGLLPSRRHVTGAGPIPSLVPSPAWSADPTRQEPPIEGNSDALGVALGGEGGQGDV